VLRLTYFNRLKFEVYFFLMFVMYLIYIHMKKGLVIALSAVLFVACQKQTTQPTPSTTKQAQVQVLENTGKLVQFLNRRFQPHAENMRFENLPNFPYYGIETALEDALTATVCHKNPGAGERQVVYITPVFTFYPDQDETGKIVPGYQVQEFLNTCIDTILSIAQNLNFEGEGTLMVSMLDVREVTVTENSVTYQLDVHYLLQTEGEDPVFDFTYNPEAAWWALTCPLTQTTYNPVAPATISLFNSQFNNPNCNPNLRWRQRTFLATNSSINNPPHPSTYGGMLMPGFVFRLMYSGLATANVQPNFTSYAHFYTNYGQYNIWSAPFSNGTPSITGSAMTDHRNGIAHRSMDAAAFPFINNYWDPTEYVISAWSGSVGNTPSIAHEVEYFWQQWKWVAIPDPTQWTSISFEEGITPLLN